MLFQSLNIAGLIPAHAGSTLGPPVTSDEARAHPRSRGEHAERPTRKFLQQGSSPLTRGAQSLLRRQQVLLGLIPAHAGSTG